MYINNIDGIIFTESVWQLQVTQNSYRHSLFARDKKKRRLLVPNKEFFSLNNWSNMFEVGGVHLQCVCNLCAKFEKGCMKTVAIIAD